MRHFWPRLLSRFPVRCICGFWCVRTLTTLAFVFVLLNGCESVPTVVSREVLADGTRVTRYSDGETLTSKPPTDQDSGRARTRQAQVGSEVKTVVYDCGDVITDVPVSIGRYGRLGVLTWSSGGAGILFGYGGALWLADDMMGNYYMLEAIPDPGPEELVFGYYADISPAGDKVAYTSCEFPQNVAAGGKYPAVSSEVGPPSANYDIVVGDLGKDGRHGIINNTRITNTSRRLDHYPVWSPDGTWIASLSMDRAPTPRELSPKFVLAQNLEVRRADGSKIRTIVVSTPVEDLMIAHRRVVGLRSSRRCGRRTVDILPII